MGQVTKTLSLGLLALTVGLVGCTKEESTTNTATSGTVAPAATKIEIVIGTTPGDFGDMVRESVASILEKKGYKVTLKEFSDYVTPNKALAEGDIDVNVFQHKPYLDTFAKDNNLELTAVFQVPTAPLGVYAGKLSKLEDVKDGSSVSVANDPSNFARGLVMLDDFGWIKLKEGANPLTVSEKDIAENPKNIKLVQMEAAQIPKTRADVDFAVINGNYATASGIKLTEALFQEPSFAYVNWGVVRTKDVNEQWVKDVIDAYNSDEFKAYTEKRFVGYKRPKNWSEKEQQSASAESGNVAETSATK